LDTDPDMILKLCSTAGLLLGLALLIPACGATKPPKQAEVPDVLSDKGSDMSGGEDARNGASLKDDKGGEQQMHAKCCGECKEGMSKDRSGGAASAIPCTDFTDTLDPICLEHFRGKKTMASECK
jgi:hypothetical protein